MALEDYRADMEMCGKCSTCKFIPLEKVKGMENINICPSISKFNFNAYSGGGRVNIGVAMLENRVEYTDKLLHMVYNCQMCGGCDISCKYAMDMEVLEPIYEFRIKCVEDGHAHPALEKVITSMRRQGTMVPAAKSRRGEWAEGLDVKDFTSQKAEVVYHAGCRTAYNNELWTAAITTVKLLQKAGIDLGIASEKELCCGGRAFSMGYKEDFLNQAKENMELFQKSGVKTLVTGCAECYHAFKVLYDKFDLKGELEILHTTEYLNRLIKEGKLIPSKDVPLKVTYHDPCHLGRLGEPFIHWKGEPLPDLPRRYDPPKEFRRGTHGSYEPPRELLRSIPGLKFTEMDRIREYAWCCGAGGGVSISNPEFGRWTAEQRIAEAESTGAEVIATACPGCVQNLKDAVNSSNSSLKILDIVQLLGQSI